jgi:hypothetical protein
MKLPELYPQYDFIILGDHPAALWGAQFLLKQGLKVLVLPIAQPQNRNFAPKFVLESFGIPVPVQGPAQIVTEKKRFRVLPTLEELKEEYFFNFGKTLQPGDLLETEIGRGLAYLTRGSETGPVIPEDWQQAFTRVNEMVYLDEPDGWLQRQMLNKLSDEGAHVLPAGRVLRIFVEKKVFVGVQVEDSSSIISAQHVLFGVNWNLITPYLSEASDVKSNPLGWMFELNLQVEPEALPLGLSHYMLYLQNGAPAIEIHHQKKGQFNVQTLLPYNEASLSHREQRRIAQRIFRVLAQLIPDLEYNLKRIQPDLRDPERTEQVELAKLFPYSTLDQIPAHRLRYGAPGLGHKSAFTGMTLAYEEAYPRLGELGAYQAVQFAVQEWAKPLQRNDVLKIQLSPNL